jgi:ABC-type sugar transport system substrate-binding protein
MKKITKKVVSAVLASVLVMASLTACGSSKTGETKESATTDSATTTESSATTEQAQPAAETKGGKILFLVSTSSGPVYDFNIAYMDMWTKELGYTYEIVYGDGANDPAGNLSAVKNAMTSDVVGLIVMQDGGISDIMTEYPDLYVAGLASDMASVYGEGGASSAAATNPKFLGTVAGGYAHGEDVGKMFAQTVEEGGYKKIAVCAFPAFAFPQYAIADKTFREEIAKYNETATEKIEIVGDEATILMFKPLEDTFFNEPQNQDLDAIVGFCGGQAFLYPPIATAIGNGTASPDTKLLTLGLENSDDLVADVGTGIVQTLFVPNYEELFYAIVMLDNTIQGKPYADYTKSEVLDGVYVHIASAEDMQKIKDNSPLLNADMTKLSLSLEDGKKFFTRYNTEATYAQLKELMASDTFSEKAYTK